MHGSPARHAHQWAVKAQHGPDKQITAASAPSSVPVTCNLCSEPVHKSPECPFQADAKTAAATAAKAARRKASVPSPRLSLTRRTLMVPRFLVGSQ